MATVFDFTVRGSPSEPWSSRRTRVRRLKTIVVREDHPLQIVFRHFDSQSQYFVNICRFHGHCALLPGGTWCGSFSSTHFCAVKLNPGSIFGWAG
jgi:hypothetical protein